MKFPIIFWQQNIIFDNKRRAFAVYKLPLINYALLSTNDKISAMYQLRELVYNAQGEYHILSLCRDFEVGSYKEQLNSLRADEEDFLPNEFEDHVLSTYNGLSNRKPWIRHLYILKQIPLKNTLIQIKNLSQLTKDFRGFANSLVDILVPAEPYIPNQILEAALVQEDAISQEVRNGMGGERVSSKDIEWMIKHNMFRGIGEPEITTNWNPATIVEASGQGKKLIPLKNEIISHIDDCFLYEGLDHIKITHVEGEAKGKESYQAFLAMTNYPENIRYPGTEFYHWLDEFDFPIDISIRLHSYESKHAQMKLSGKMKELQDQKEQHANSTTGIPLHIHDNEYKGMELESKIKGGMPLLDVVTIFCIAAPDKETLEKRVDAVMGVYRPRQFKLVRTPGDQKKFFSTFIPTFDVKMKEHTVAMDPEFFASGMMNASRQIGDPTGFYLGDNVSGSMTPVLMYPMRGPRNLNRSAAMGILGTLGGGKSVTRKYILYAAMTIWGAKVISIDPKNEDFCYNQIPEIARNMKQVDLGPGSTVTINPYHISPVEETSRTIVTELLFMLLKAETDLKENRQLAIYKAVAHVMSLPHSERSLIATLEYFEKMSKMSESESTEEGITQVMTQEAITCVSLMQTLRSLNFSSTLFSKTSNIDASSQLTVFNFQGLPLPADKNSNMSNSERVGSAILFLVTSFAREVLLSSEYKDILKILSIDEAWKMMMTPEGIRLITEIIRMGRSKGIMPIIATQNANDLSGTEIRNNLGMIMMFRNPDQVEIEQCLDMIGLDKEDESLKQRVPNFKSGQCIFRDIEGRIAEIQIRPRPGTLLDVFNTSV